MAVRAGLVLGHAGVVARVCRPKAREGQQRGEGVDLCYSHLRSWRQRPSVSQPGEADREVSPGQAAEEADADALAVDGLRGGGAGAEGDYLWGDCVGSIKVVAGMVKVVQRRKVEKRNKNLGT